MLNIHQKLNPLKRFLLKINLRYHLASLLAMHKQVSSSSIMKVAAHKKMLNRSEQKEKEIFSPFRSLHKYSDTTSSSSSSTRRLRLCFYFAYRVNGFSVDPSLIISSRSLAAASDEKHPHNIF
jgi:hypothetical protein